MTEVRVLDDGGEGVRTADVGGGCLSVCWLKSAPELKQIVNKMPDFKCRDDDVMLCTHSKTGSNWCFEVIMMLLKQSSERVKIPKMLTMMEVQTAEELDAVPSPRLLNTHHLSKYLPRDLARKKIKTVLCVRNPKDAAVSYYNHMTGFKCYDYDGKWENWLRPYVEGKFEFGTYAAYLNDFQTLIESGPEFPIHVMYFEDLKTDFLAEVTKLATFLNVDVDDKLKQEIVEMCHFDKMAKEKVPAKAQRDAVFKPHFSFFRKGVIGDWRNWFTDDQNKMFDAAWNRDIRKDSMFTFRYTLD